MFPYNFTHNLTIYALNPVDNIVASELSSCMNTIDKYDQNYVT